jgi:hypothetical protein
MHAVRRQPRQAVEPLEARIDGEALAEARLERLLDVRGGGLVGQGEGYSAAARTGGLGRW